MKNSLLLLTFVVAILDLVVPKEINFILIFCVIYLVPSDYTAINKSISKILPFLALVIIGGLLGAHNNNKDFIRDLFIFSKTIVYFLSGVILSKYIKDFGIFFRYFIIFAFVSSLTHIGAFLLHMKSAGSLETIRQTAGYGNEAQAIVLSIFISGLFNKSLRKLIGNYSIKYKVFISIIAISFLLYFSRTLIVIFLVVALFLSDGIYIRNILSKKNRGIFKVAVVMIFFCSLIIFIASLQPPDSPLARLVDKFKNIPSEVTWNAKKNQEAVLEDINDNWRGYEAYQGLLKFKDGNTFKKFFGHGFGEKVDLGISMKLAGKYYEQIPILHNAYVTLLVKSGVIGIACYLLFFYQLGFRRAKDSDNKDLEMYYSYQILSGLCVATIINTFTMRGLLGDTATIQILLGFFWGNIIRRKLSYKGIKHYDVPEEETMVKSTS